MERRNKRNITIGILCTLLVFMGVGYAALNQVLDINGTARSTNTWSVLIKSIIKKASSDGVTSTERVGVDNTKSSDNATFSVDFIKPGDYIEYDIVVKNSGTIAGQVSEVNFTTTNTELFTTSFDNSIINKTISAGDSETFTIRIDYNSEATTLVTGEEQFQLVLTSVQGEGSNIAPEPVEGDWLYKVNSDGLITAFNYDSPQAKDGAGNYVANIPAEVDGIPVTEINENSFLQFNVLVGDELDVVIKDAENATEISNALNEYASFVGAGSLIYHNEGDINTDGFNKLLIDVDAYKNAGSINENNVEEIVKASENKLSILDLSQATNLTTIGERAFTDSNLTTVNLGNTITTIGDNAFTNNQISSLIIPNSVITIGEGAFRENQINSLTIPNSVTTIGRDAFRENQISNLTIGSGVTSIGYGTFLDQRGALTSITIKRSEADFLANVSIGDWWYDNMLNPTITYNPS